MDSANAAPLYVFGDRDVDVRRVGMLHPDDIVAGIDVQDFGGDAARHVGQQIHRRVAHLVGRDRSPQRRIVLGPSEDIAEIADARRRQRLDRAGRDGVDADFLGAEIGGEIANRHLERGFGDAHDVVVRNPFLAAVVRQRQQRAAVRHHLLGALGDGRERIAGDQHGPAEIVRRGVDIAAIELASCRRRRWRAPRSRASPRCFCAVANTASMVRRIGHVAMAEHVRADLLAPAARRAS